MQESLFDVIEGVSSNITGKVKIGRKIIDLSNIGNMSIPK